MDYHDIEASLLSGFLRDRHLFTIALNEGFHVDLLATPVARRLVKALFDLYGRSAAVDEVAVRAHLDDHGLLSPEMERYLGAVVARTPPNAGQVIGYLDLLKARESRELLQKVYEELGAFLHKGGDRPQDIIQVTGEAIGRLMEIQKRRMRKQVAPVSTALGDLVEFADRADPVRQLGFSIRPFDRLNEVLSGLRRGFYYGLAGAPRRGKTNFALELATFIAANHRTPVLYYTWEQTRRVLGARLMARETGLNPTWILAGADPEGRSIAPRLREAQQRMARYAPYLYVVEAGRQHTLDRIRAHAYNLMQEFETSDIVIFFDYLQKIPLSEYVDDQRARTDFISTALAELSLELNCPIFAISPLDKEGCRLDERPADEAEEFNVYNRPTMHHSMGSGDLEYDLDVAMVLVKDWKATRDLREYLESKARQEGLDPEELPKIDILNLFIDKNRDAPEVESNIVQFAFFITLNKFVELGFKLEKEYRADFRGFSKVVEIYNQLKEAGLLSAHREVLAAGT